MQVTSASCVAAVHWPTPLHDCVGSVSSDNVCCDEMFAMLMHVYNVIVLYVQYIHCSPDCVAILGLHHVPQYVLRPHLPTFQRNGIA